jgi:hypothetical protein
MFVRPSPRAARRLIVVLVVLAGAMGCLPLPTDTASPSVSPSLTPEPTPTPTPEASLTPLPTPEPYSLANPSATDPRHIRVTITPALPTDGSGTITVTVLSLDQSIVQELVLRWSTQLDEHLFLAPFTPSEDRVCNGCPPLVQEWTKWVVGPGARGEPAGTTSLGWGPLVARGRLTIPIVANRRLTGPVSFDLQILAGEALLTLEDQSPAWFRVEVP